MIQVKVLMTINIDESEYPVPSDGRVDEEVEDAYELFSRYRWS